MMRHLAAACVFACFTFVGYMQSYRIKARAEALSALITDIKQLGQKLEFTALPLSVLIERMDKSHLPELWNSMLARLKNGDDAKTAWRGAEAECKTDVPLFSALKETELELFDDYFSAFSSANLKGQLTNAQQLCSRAEKSLSELEKDGAGKARALLAAFSLMGLAAAVLIW